MSSLNKTPLKYFKTLRMYKNSSGSNTFNTVTQEAHSYKWWKYVARINGKLVFNGYSYSVTTSGHQGRMRQLLSQLGINIDLYIEAPKGLNDLRNAIEWNEKKLIIAEDKIKRARKEHTKQWHLKAINNAKTAIEFLKPLVK